MKWLSLIATFIKGLFQTLNNPERLEIKKEKVEMDKVEHAEDVAVREAERILEIERLTGKTEKVEDKNDRKDERREDKKEYGPFHRIKKRRDERRIDTDN